VKIISEDIFQCWNL